jgi:hypothetical protein
VDALKDIKPNQLIYVKEGAGILRSETFGGGKKEQAGRVTPPGGG